jgi:hypothetical protein
VWQVEITDEFAEWFNTLDHLDREKLTSSVELLEARGPRSVARTSTPSTVLDTRT